MSDADAPCGAARPRARDALAAFTAAARRRGLDRYAWSDRGTRARIVAGLALEPERCRVDDYRPEQGRLDLVVQVRYRLDLGEFTACWYEVRDALLYADGRVEIEWRPDEVPHVPFARYVPDLLHDDAVTRPDHPYWAFTRRSLDAAGQVELRSAGPPLPPAEAADYTIWRAKAEWALRRPGPG